MLYYKKLDVTLNSTCENHLNSPTTAAFPKDARLLAAQAWLAGIQPALTAQGWAVDPASLAPASSDASFRRYFRLNAQQAGQRTHLILMDAPPGLEDIQPFLSVGSVLQQAGLHVPPVVAQDTSLGFLLLGDLGTRTYLEELTTESPEAATPLYQDAWRALIRLQQHSTSVPLPAYDAAKLLQEMRLFDEWYLGKHLQVTLTPAEMQDLQLIYQRILARCVSQTQVIVHRDYHSRNLMVTPENNPGVLDFQDAVIGPITYDLASLLRDAYIVWPEEVQLDWAIRYWQEARHAGLAVPPDFADFWADLEWMGLQRHLKVLGIFARLFYRDGKAGYLNDLPAVLAYADLVARRYVALAPLARLFYRLGQQPAAAAGMN
jgi:N-acetylmuramate 1-kinase